MESFKRAFKMVKASAMRQVQVRNFLNFFNCTDKIEFKTEVSIMRVQLPFKSGECA